MLTTMTDKIRKAVKIELLEQGIKQTDLAADLQISRQYLSQLLNGHSGKALVIWEKLLEKLDMTIMPIPNSKVSDVKRALVD